MRLPVYLDYAATTPVEPQVAEKMLAFLTAAGQFANPASQSHDLGRAAARAVEAAREQVAALVGAEAGEIVWTSGATEANNLAIKGAAQLHRKRGRHIVTAKTEHKAVLDVCRQLGRDGWDVTYLDPDPGGLIAPGQLAAALRDDTVLASLMHVNNETGVVQDLEALGGVCRQRGVLFHVDAAQSAARLPIDLSRLPVDLMSLSAHKLYGPKGIGALYLRRWPRARIAPQIHGGGHERGLRAGTLPTHQIVGMGEACAIAAERRDADAARLRALEARLWDGIRDLEAVYRNGDPQRRAAGILNVGFEGVHGEALLLDLKDIALASGSACTSAAAGPSHVLRAMGVSDRLARSALRFSLGRGTTAQEIDFTVRRVRAAVARLRELSPLWDLYREGVDLDAVAWESY